MIVGKRARRGLVAGLVVLGAVLCGSSGVSVASAETPAWYVSSTGAPSNLPLGGSGTVYVTVANLGDETANGVSDPVVITDRLPAGLTANSIEGRVEAGTKSMVCDLASLSCTYEGLLRPYFAELQVVIGVTVASGSASDPQNSVRVSGGGAKGVDVSEPLSLSSAPSAFGVEKVVITPTNEDGSVDTQAGSHPDELTATINLNNKMRSGKPPGPVGTVKDLSFKLPPGLIGDPQVVPTCNEQQFDTFVQAGAGENLCPPNTVIGVAHAVLGTMEVGEGIPPLLATVPLYNLPPAPGEPARFGFGVVSIPVILDTEVRTGSDYGVNVVVKNISQLVPFIGSRVTFWGVPSSPSHDLSRGWKCLRSGQIGVGGCIESAAEKEVPFLTLPTSCDGPLQTTVEADSWLAPEEKLSGVSLLGSPFGSPLGMTGCNRLRFEPSISVAPDGNAGSTPTGLTVGVHVPQEGSLNPTGLSEADVKNTTVALPAGVALNPSGADGLLSCSIGQVGFEHIDPSSETSLFSPNGVACPDASKVGTVEIETPLLPHKIVGKAYLAAQDLNPFGSLVAIYLVAQDPVSGVLVKFAGEVSLDQHSGQLVTTFKNTAQLPFEDLRLHFFGGDRAPLASPAQCGTYTTDASIAPWSANPPATPTSSFQITSGPNGSPCSSRLPFAPGLSAGSSNIQAGAFTPFSLTMSREDGQQTLNGIQLHLPSGLLGDLANVKLCEEPQAEAGSCGPESLIGHTVVSVGLGGDPYTVSGGQVFITGPYKGAPYGLSILEPAKAGPFDLGHIVVRAGINVDPTTAALTITSYPLPTIIAGIPLQIKHVNVTIDRSSFTFNPTNCNPNQISGMLSSTEGASSGLSVPFQVTNCATLAFKPQFHVSTSGHTSRAHGASLDVKLTYPKGPQGAETNIARVKVDLPKQLPSRLSTLQKACPDYVFDANPARCSAGSRVGVARATTPVLPTTLTGPAFFVSHGGAKFPELIVVLQANGVRVDLHGETFISKSGITSSTFAGVPDVPIGSFELYLPQGSNSALAAIGNLCKSKLAMPTSFVAQNGVVIHKSTPITVTGCAKPTTRKAHKTNKKNAQSSSRHKKGNGPDRTVTHSHVTGGTGPASGRND